MESDHYQVQTEFFEGPLDLLLHLIRKRKMNILDVSLSEITTEYLTHLDRMDGINPTREGDFLMTASTLIYIKSRTLLPRPKMMEEESEESKLLHTLLEYDKIKKITSMLKEMEGTELTLWKRESIKENFENREFEIEEVSAFQLAEVFFELVRRKDKEEFLFIQSKFYSVEKKWNEILELIENDGMVNFNGYLSGLDSIEEILVSFFTLLEMVKQKVVVAVQKRLFDTISVWKNEPGQAQ